MEKNGFESLLQILKCTGAYNESLEWLEDLQAAHERDTWMIGAYSDEVNKLKAELDSLKDYARDLFIFASTLACNTPSDRLALLDAMLDAHEERMKEIYPDNQETMEDED